MHIIARLCRVDALNGSLPVCGKWAGDSLINDRLTTKREGATRGRKTRNTGSVGGNPQAAQGRGRRGRDPSTSFPFICPGSSGGPSAGEGRGEGVRGRGRAGRDKGKGERKRGRRGSWGLDVASFSRLRSRCVLDSETRCRREWELAAVY